MCLYAYTYIIQTDDDKNIITVIITVIIKSKPNQARYLQRQLKN